MTHAIMICSDVGIGEAIPASNRRSEKDRCYLRARPRPGVTQNAEVDATSAAGATFDFDLRMLLAQVGKDGIESADELNIDALLFVDRNLIPNPAPTNCGCNPI